MRASKVIEIESISQVLKYTGDLKAIVFDLDDTLYNETEYVYSGYCAIAKSLPNVDNMENKLWKSFLNKKNAIDEVLTNEKIYSPELKQKCLDTYRFHKPDIHLGDDVKELLFELKNKGYKLGIITDGRPEGQKAKIESLGLADLVDHIIITDELGGVEYRKPNALAFKKMRELLNVEYDQMCYVGDNINKDFIAPDELGMKSILLKNPKGLYYK